MTVETLAKAETSKPYIFYYKTNPKGEPVDALPEKSYLKQLEEGTLKGAGWVEMEVASKKAMDQWLKLEKELHALSPHNKKTKSEEEVHQTNMRIQELLKEQLQLQR